MVTAGNHNGSAIDHAVAILSDCSTALMCSFAILTSGFFFSVGQVISTIVKHLTVGLPQLDLNGKTKTPAVAFGKAEQEHVVIFRGGELLQVCFRNVQ